MTYWLLNLPFLAVVAVVAVAAVLARRAPRWRAVGLAAIVLLPALWHLLTPRVSAP